MGLPLLIVAIVVLIVISPPMVAAVVHVVMISELGWFACGAQFWTPPRHQQEMVKEIKTKRECVAINSKYVFLKNW